MSISQATSVTSDSQHMAQSAARLVTLGLQHVLVMYAGAIALQLIIGRALKLLPEQVAALIRADLFFNGLASSDEAQAAARDNTHGAE